VLNRFSSRPWCLLTATGIGWLNGIGNLVGAAAPVIMGWVIAMSGGNFAYGLFVIVAGSVICSGFYLALHVRLRLHARRTGFAH
jgi:hypothetical protein